MPAELLGVPRYLAVPPSTCMTEVDRLGWAVSVPLRAGNHVLGVRVGAVAVADVLRELFADRVVADADLPDGELPGNLSLYLAPPATDGTQELHRLYVTYSRVLRTRSVARSLDALWHELDVRDVEVARQRPQLHATVVVRDRGAYVLPVSRRRRIVDDERRWRREGFALVDRRTVDLDAPAGTLHIPASGLPATHPPLPERLTGLGIAHRDDPPQPAGTLPIAGWQLEDGTLAGRVLQAAGQVGDRAAHDGVALVEGLAQLLDGLAEFDVPTR